MSAASPHRVFVTGGTGYLGRALVPRLLERGHQVRVLARPGSEGRVPAGAEIVNGNALDGASYSARITPSDTFVQLVGTPHPAPWKGAQFEAVDLVSIRAAVAAVGAAAPGAGIRHFVYLSAAHPAPVMKDYLKVRVEGEALVRAAAAAGGFGATFLRPWYVLGPGHRWPWLLVPVYALLERLPGTGPTARRLGLVTLRQMVGSLLWAIESPADGIRPVDVPELRRHPLPSGTSVD